MIHCNEAHLAKRTATHEQAIGMNHARHRFLHVITEVQYDIFFLNMKDTRPVRQTEF